LKAILSLHHVKPPQFRLRISEEN